MAAIDCVGLTKVYAPQIVALNKLSLSIEAGAAFGVLGENGAGKSTLVRLLMGFIRPTAGTVRVLDHNQVAQAHPLIGYVHERPIFDPRFTGRELLRYFADLAGLRGSEREARIDVALTQVDLAGPASRRVSGYSKGMQQRLAIAQALLTDPALLILDEVTSGIDPGSQWEIRQIIAALHRQGKTILLCSHYLAEVEAICERVGILQRGRLIREGLVQDMVRVRDVVEIVLAEGQATASVVERLGLMGEVLTSEGATLRIAAAAQPLVLAALIAAGIPIRSLNPVSQTLEEVYIATTRGPAPEKIGGSA